MPTSVDDAPHGSLDITRNDDGRLYNTVEQQGNLEGDAGPELDVSTWNAARTVFAA